MSRGGALMGKRALITSVQESSHKDKEGFVVDPFWGSSTPQGIAGLPHAVQAGDQAGLRAALTVAVEHLGGGEVGDDDVEAVSGDLLRGTIAVVAAAVRAKADEDTMTRDLAAIGISGAPAADIVRAVSRSRDRITANASELGRAFPSVEDIRWRLDVTISTTHLSRVLRPNFFVQLTLSDGNIRTLEMETDKLQSLRFQVASALQSMQSMQASLANIAHAPKRAAQTLQVKSGIAKNAAVVAAALGAQPPSPAETKGRTKDKEGAGPGPSIDLPSF